MIRTRIVIAVPEFPNPTVRPVAREPEYVNGLRVSVSLVGTDVLGGDPIMFSAGHESPNSDRLR